MTAKLLQRGKVGEVETPHCVKTRVNIVACAQDEKNIMFAGAMFPAANP
jgi:hypothetical protein